MKKLIATLFIGTLVATANAQLTGRLFFDTAGNGGNQSGAHPGGLALNNPVLNGPGRLYIYWGFGVPSGQGQNVLGLNYNVTVDGGSISQAMNYQPTINVLLQPRWQNVPGNPAPNPAVNPGGNSARFTAVNINAFGLKNDAAAVALDQGYNAASNSTILGYVDVESQNGSVWLTVDTLGIAIQGGSPNDRIYMGFGDNPVPAGGAPGTRTSIADATIVPEPASLMLLGLGALALRRRR
jgi:hypothetical protein